MKPIDLINKSLIYPNGSKVPFRILDFNPKTNMVHFRYHDSEVDHYEAWSLIKHDLETNWAIEYVEELESKVLHHNTLRALGFI